MEAKYQETTLGEPICEKIKDIYFSDIAWSECYRDVAKKFSLLKAIASKFYADKTQIEVLKELIKYRKEDIVEMFAL